MASPLPPPQSPKPREERPRPVTIKDVAKVAGVHFTTVSMALRDHPSLLPSTKEHIRAVANRLGYVPNPVFSALTHFRLNGRVRADPPRIGYLVNQSFEQGTGVYRHLGDFLDGAREQARVMGYDLDLIQVPQAPDGSTHVESYLKEHAIAGVIIAAFEPGLPSVSLNWENYAVVKIHSLHIQPEATTVGNDHRQDVRLAFQQMRALGYRRIGLAVGLADVDATERRHLAGYSLEQMMIPAEERVPELLFPYGATISQVTELLGNWVRQHKIDAVLCNWSVIMRMLQDAGFRVPQDVACACLCMLEKDEQLAGVCPNLKAVGAKAVSLLTALIKSGVRGVPEFASQTYVRSYWQNGASAPQKV